MSDGASPPRPVRRIRRIIPVSSGSGSDSEDGVGPSRTRKKRLRVLSSGAESDSASSDSLRADGSASDSSEGNSDKCSICLLRFRDQPVGTPENCEHVFCLDCITEWSKNVNTCPVDRSTFESIVVRSRLGGHVLRSEAVVVVERRSSVDLLVVEDPTMCEVCGSSEGEETMLLCDGCDLGFHMACLTPPLLEVPLDQWFCGSCVGGRELAPGLLLEPQLAAPAPSRAAPLPRQRAAPPRRAAPSRRKTSRRRTRTVIVEYELEGDGKFPVTERVRRKIRRRKTKRVSKRAAERCAQRRARPKTAARRALVRASVRAVLRAQRPAAAPSLRLFEPRDQLDYFEDEAEESGGPTMVAVAARPTPAVFSAYRQARRKMISVPSPPAASAAPDLLADILESQALLHARDALLSVRPDGRLDVRRRGAAARQAPAGQGGGNGVGGGGGGAEGGSGGAARGGGGAGWRGAALEGRVPPAGAPYDPAEPTGDDAALQSAVRHVLQRRGLLHSDDEEAGDCPNFSIYSAASVHIASASLTEQEAPPPEPDEQYAPDYKERLSRRCPITPTARNPIKIKINTPSLMKRVSLYDEEDPEGPPPEEPRTSRAPPPAESSPPPPSPPPAAPLNGHAPPEPPPDTPPRDETAPEDDEDDDKEEEDEKYAEEEEEEEGEDREEERNEDRKSDSPAGPEKMTESISETEDERSYTPCLDEPQPPALDQLGTELISEEEGHFSDEERRQDRKRKKKKRARSPRPEPAFKKVTRNGKERHYRSRSRDRASAERRSADRGRQRRQDLQRYDVRTLVSAKKRPVKDAFGRDVSPHRRSSSGSPRPPRRRRDSSPVSPPRRRRSLEGGDAPRRRRSAEGGGAARRRRSGSAASPGRRAPSPARRRREGSSPRRRPPSRSPPRPPKRKKRSRERRLVADPPKEKKKKIRNKSKSPRRKTPKPKKSKKRAVSPPPSPPRSWRSGSPRTPPRRRRAPLPSKEVFTSGNNILVSVSFKDQEPETAPRRKRRASGSERREKRRRRLAAAEPTVKPVAIIDLERSPFRELTPSPKNVIVLSDSDHGEEGGEDAAAAAPAPGPKTPPSPPLEEPPPPAAASPGSAPSSHDAYDPFEPTNSPEPPPPADPPRSLTLEAAQKTNLSADDVLDQRPLTPGEKVLALLASTRDAPPEPVPGGGAPADPPPPQELPKPAPKLFLAKPSPIKSSPIKPMPATKISMLPLPAAGRRADEDGESPYSPGSSDFGDLFEPPHDAFAPRRRRPRHGKGAHHKGAKTQVGVKIDDDNLKILDELPNSAVEMQVKSKFLKKLNRQERVVEEVKLVLKPHYNKKRVSKDEYKDVLRRAVPKICHNKSGEINPAKIQALVEAYVKKIRKKHKLGLA